MSIGYIVTPEELREHMKNGGRAVFSVKLASGNDWAVTVDNFYEYEIVEDDILFDFEVLLLENSKEK